MSIPQETETVTPDAVGEINAFIADIRRVWPDSYTPPEERETFLRWQKEHKDHVDRLQAVMAAHLAWWLIRGREAGHDPDVLDQVALQAVQRVIAVTVRAMKARQGEPFEPARVAIVAYAVAKGVAEAGGVANLEGMADEADKIGAFVTSEAEAEIKHLRTLITEIAAAKTDEISMMEQAWIIERCKEEVARWKEQEAP